LTRVWTYQKIKLATNSVVATKAGFVPFSEIVRVLGQRAHAEVGNDFKSDGVGKFPSLYRTMVGLQRDDIAGVSLPDIGFGCGYRKAWDSLDYARAMFPTLGIEWRVGYDLESAMQKVYERQKQHASRLMLFHGPPRAAYPGWAPAVFPGLVDGKIIEAGTWKARGLERSWLTSRVRRIVPSKPGALILELDNERNSGALCLAHVSKEAEQKSPKIVEAFRLAVSKGTAYLLSDELLFPKEHFCRVALAVERFTKASDMEAWVCMTLAIGETEETYRPERSKWLLLHENPVSDRLLSGRTLSGLRWAQDVDTSVCPTSQTQVAGATELHIAAQTGEPEIIKFLLSETDANVVDARG